MHIFDQLQPIILHIFVHLGHKTHFKLKSVCKYFKLLIESKSISGTEPRNFFECIIDDNIYYLGKYLNIFDQPASILTTSPYNTPKYDMRKLILKYCTVFNSSPKIYEFLNINDYKHTHRNCQFLPTIIEINVYINDLINLKKINTIWNKTHDCQEKSDDSFFQIYKFNIVVKAIMYNKINIVKYMLDDYDISPNEVLFFITKSFDLNHTKIGSYIFKNFLNVFDIDDLIHNSIMYNHLNFLTYIVNNKLFDKNLDIVLDYVAVINFLTIKYYFNNFKHTKSFVSNLKLITDNALSTSDVKTVNYCLANCPALVNYYKLNKPQADPAMINILIKHKILICTKKFNLVDYFWQSVNSTMKYLFLTISGLKSKIF